MSDERVSVALSRREWLMLRSILMHVLDEGGLLQRDEEIIVRLEEEIASQVVGVAS